MKYKISVICCMLLAITLFGCGKERKAERVDFSIYYVSTEVKGLEAVAYELKAQEPEEKIKEVFAAMKEQQKSKGITSSIPSNIILEKFELSEGHLALHFEKTAYQTMKKGTEVLMRAAVVQTMVQLDEVEFVSFYLGEEALLDSYGEPIGIMNAENFLQNTNSKLASYQSTSLELYFASSDGMSLQKEVREDVHYNANTSVEKLVVEQLIDGPNVETLGATVPEKVKVLGVSVKDGICYVNLSSTFLTNIYNQKPEVAIYSLVNSLIANANVLKVQILIEGAKDVTFLNAVDLSQPLEWNEEIIIVQEQQE